MAENNDTEIVLHGAMEWQDLLEPGEKPDVGGYWQGLRMI